ncbi:hypothetical protein HQQ80_05870 [Microbacteriaceae bacterium VKM Ac-2855]|nr:hypothetical protein [Microbacteriaceae bacterium VKM Ac-2855]
MSDPASQETPMPSNEPTPDEATEPKPTPAAATKRRASSSVGTRRRSALRVGVGVVGFAIVAAAIVVPQLIATPDVSTAAGGTVITPVPAASTLVCGGDFIDAGDPETLTTVAGTGRAFWPTGIATEAAVLAQPDFTGSANPGNRTFTVPPDDDGTAPTPAGVVTQIVGTDTLSGLSAVGCDEADADSWIVAGSTGVGNTSVLVLANPTEVAATVDLSLYGENGPIAAAGSTGIVVPPLTSRAISLAGLAPDVIEPVIRVVARGGQISASLQSSAIAGLDPVGVETTATGAGLSTEVTIPGFTIASPSAEIAGDDGSGQAGAPVVRILAPGDADATVTVRIANEDPSGSGTSTSVVVPAGRATEVPLSELAEGSYTISLSSDQPIVAGARSTSSGEAGTDFAWFVSTNAVTGQFGVANTGERSSVLHVLNAGQDSASIVVNVGGEDRTLAVGPTTAVTIDLGVAPAIVTSDQPVYASVSIADAGRIASYPVVPQSPLASPITIYDH